MMHGTPGGVENKRNQEKRKKRISGTVVFVFAALPAPWCSFLSGS